MHASAGSVDVWRSTDEGATWSKINDFPTNSILAVVQHPFHDSVVSIVLLYSTYYILQAFALAKDGKHFKTDNSGQSWSPFSFSSSLKVGTLAFNYKNPNLILHTDQCDMSYGCNPTASIPESIILSFSSASIIIELARNTDKIGVIFYKYGR